MDKIICHDQKSWARENSVDALAHAIACCATKKSLTLGRNAARKARRLYSWERVFDELFCIYREVRANYRQF